MKTLFILIASGVGGAVGWSVGMRVGIGTAYLLSSVGTLAGVYAGWRAWREFLS